MNRLQFEKSPYLLQHAENPVDWRPWGQEAFADARREGKPVFLSVGYSTCHWCHVMAHESFESAEVAEVLNRDFIPVKVDREERPDVDAVYMAACVAMNGSGGWPLTALLTPEQQPFWAGTYLPERQLLSLLEQASALWREDRARALAAGAELTAQLRRTEASRLGTPGRELLAAGAAAFSRSYDPAWGGFGRAPKFPSAHNLLFLLRYAHLTGDSRARGMAEGSLEHMYRGGIFDHAGGGFSRYSTDARWLVPHFEKTLYDNALLAMAYTEAYRMTGRPWYREVVRRTLDYVLAELTDPLGGFYCGQDADSDGVEGKFYVFTPEELTGLLGGGAARFCRRYGVTEEGNFQGGKSVLNLIGAPDWETEPEGFDGMLQAVRDYRRTRTRLHRDDKVLTAWNGLMIAALARAGLVLAERRYLEAGLHAAEFIRTRLTGEDGCLLARWREGEAAHPGKLDDYAFYIWGLLELYGAVFHVELLEEACRAAGRLLEAFFDGENGGFYPYSADGEQLITRTKESYDGAMPSGNAAAGLALSRLGRLTGERRWRDAAALQLRYLAGAAEQFPAGHSFTLLALAEELWPAGELVVTGEKTPELLTLLRETRRKPLALVKTPENAERLAALAPFTAEYPVPPEGARYYLCREGACQSPTDNTEALAALLS